jgi:hypothetical protein
MDQTKKTMRHFYCRDLLWETFEAMANDFDCSIDYLINESMRLYARSKNYQVPSAGPPSQIMPSAGQATGQGGPARPGVPTPSASFPRPTTALNAIRPGTAPSPSVTMARPATVPPIHTPPPTAPRTNPPASSVSAIPLTPSPTPTGQMPGNWAPPLNPASATTGGEVAAPPLFLLFQGQRLTIDKEQYIIGRGSKTGDLAIKDGNISRQHAMVLRRNGAYYIKDLGSTNGIEYKGMRIDNKRIDEGDIFFICDYELKFTYQP